MKLIRFPQTAGRYKLVQLYAQGSPVTGFGHVYDFHTRILAETLDAVGINELSCLRPGSGYGYDLRGVGELRLNPRERVYTHPTGWSKSFGMGPSEELTQLLHEELADWNLVSELENKL